MHNLLLSFVLCLLILICTIIVQVDGLASNSNEGIQSINSVSNSNGSGGSGNGKEWWEEMKMLLEWRVLLAGGLSFLGASLCAGAGIGGGAVYISLFSLLLQMGPHLAVPLSKVTIFGVAIGSYCVNSQKRHPTANRPLINYKLAVLMEPMTLLGTILGVYLNVICPAYLIVAFLCMLLSFSAWKTIRKGIKVYKQEQAIIAQERELSGAHNNDDIEETFNDEAGITLQDMASQHVQETTDSAHSTDDSETAFTNQEQNLNNISPAEQLLLNEADTVDVDNDAETDNGFSMGDDKLQAVLDGEKRIPYLWVLALAILWCCMFVLVLLKGGNGESIIGVKCNTWQYWLIVLLNIPLLSLFSFGVAYFIRTQYLQKVSLSFDFIEGDVRWTIRNTFVTPILSILAGVAAGFLGIGGGMVKGPLMLSMDVVPQVAAATSAFMILFTSSSTTSQFIILGKLPLQFAVLFFITGFTGAVVGTIGLAYIVKKYKKQSFVSFLLGSTIVMSAILMTGLLVKDMWEGTASMHFNGVCGDIK